MKIIIGIGNPERKYEGTRHNIGFEILDGLAAVLGLQAAWKESKKIQAVALKTDGALLVKPLTYVNRTGESMREIFREYRPALKDVLVVSDDVNLDFGKLRLRSEGSAGGHHGLESIIAALDGSIDFPRLRFGVRNDHMPRDLNGFVLEKFSRDEKEKVGVLKDNAISVCVTWLNGDLDAAMKKLSQLQG